MVEAFSLLAVGTSLIGTLLGFSEFFKEQLKNRMLEAPLKWTSKVDMLQFKIMVHHTSLYLNSFLFNILSYARISKK